MERKITPTAVRRWNLAGTLVGAAIWLLLWLVPPLGQGIMDAVAHLLLFAVLVVVPLALPLLGFEPVDRASRISLLVLKLHSPAALMAAASFLLSPGVVAGFMALAWMLFT